MASDVQQTPFIKQLVANGMLKNNFLALFQIFNLKLLWSLLILIPVEEFCEFITFSKFILKSSKYSKYLIKSLHKVILRSSLHLLHTVRNPISVFLA